MGQPQSTEPLVEQYVDLQVNGYAGIDFNDPATSVADIRLAARRMVDDGVTSAWPTVITASLGDMRSCLENLVTAIEEDKQVARVFVGLHIEGPFISPVPGFVGAHPAEHVIEAADPDALQLLLDSAGGHAKLVTLAPELAGCRSLIEQCLSQRVLVAAGHTDATRDDLERAIEAGLSLFTHLGNGCPQMLHRHDNIMWRVLALREQLKISVIADGFHVPKDLFHFLLDVVPTSNLCVVSDAISAAGLGPGTYRLGNREVSIGEDRAVRDRSGEHFVGAATTLRQADQWLRDDLKLSLELRRKLLHDNASACLGDFAD